MRSTRGRRRRRLAALAVGIAACGAPARAQAPESGLLAAEASRLRVVAREVRLAHAARGAATTRASTALLDARRVLHRAGVPGSATSAFLESVQAQLDEESTPAAASRALQDVAARLDAIAALDQSPDGGVAPPQQMARTRAALEAELAGPAYAPAEDAAVTRLMRAMTQYLLDRLNRLFESDVLSGMERVSYFIMLGLFAALLGVVAWLLATRFGRRPGSPPDTGSPVVETRRMSDPEAYRVEADGHAAVGRFREAVRAQFLRILAELEARRLVVFDRSRTNAEYLDQLRRRGGGGPLVDDFQAVARTYDRAWYGRVPSAAEDYAVFADRVGEAVRRIGAAR